jgi:hypothetical protein
MHWLKALQTLSKSACRLRGKRWRRRPGMEMPQTLRCLPAGVLRSARCSFPPPPLLCRRIA